MLSKLSSHPLCYTVSKPQSSMLVQIKNDAMISFAEHWLSGCLPICRDKEKTSPCRALFLDILFLTCLSERASLGLRLCFLTSSQPSFQTLSRMSCGKPEDDDGEMPGALSFLELCTRHCANFRDCSEAAAGSVRQVRQMSSEGYRVRKDGSRILQVSHSMLGVEVSNSKG